jgi:hypothetical protein
MVMEMKDGLARVVAAVYDHAKTVFGDALFVGELGDQTEDIGKDIAIALLEVQQSGDVLTRDDQDMHGGFRINIPEGEHRVVPINNLRFDLAVNDTAEKTIAHRTLLSLPATKGSTCSSFE